MASPVKLYQKEMHSNLGFFATWLPGDLIEIGDVGVLEKGRFRRATSLKELGIDYSVSAGQSTQNIQYTSTVGTKITTSAGAAVPELAKAKITIEFSQEGAFVFNSLNLRPRRLENRAAVADEILEAYEKDKWEKEWLLVEAFHHADYVTIIVSEDKSADLELVASANVTLPTVSLADPKIGLSIASTRGKIVHFIGAQGLHPLYSCLRLKDPLFGDPSIKPVRGSGEKSGELPFSRPDIDDLLNS